jgi:hypothetical protein
MKFFLWIVLVVSFLLATYMITWFLQDTSLYNPDLIYSGNLVFEQSIFLKLLLGLSFALNFFCFVFLLRLKK